MAEKNHSKVFVYGDYLGMGFCVLPKDKAEEFADLGDDVGHGCETTAREFFDRRRQKSGIYDKEWAEELLDDLEAGEFELALNEPLEIFTMPGSGDGYFPPSPFTSMLDWLPEDVFEAGIGVVVDNMGWIPRYEIEESDLERIREVLEGLGYEVLEGHSYFDRMA